MVRENSRALGRNLKIRTDSVDRISYLPDSIISHILCFLPTKNAVATGILSKRWSLLWTTAINLDFCFPIDQTQTYGESQVENKIRKFVQFVNYVLILHKHGCLNKFSLTWDRTFIPFHVTTWINAALAKNVRELSVCVINPVLRFPSGGRMIQVPRSLFRYEGLRSLELNFNFCIPSEIVISLPKLESLKLISFHFDSDYHGTFSKLLGGCPVLKYLYIDIDIGRRFSYHNEDVFKCIVSSTSLKHLELHVHDKHDYSEGKFKCCVELDAPSLEYVILKDMISSVVIQPSLSSLVEANVELLATKSEVEDRDYCNSFVNAISALECAKALTLSSDAIWALSYATDKLKTRFKRLLKLEVSISCCYWSSFLDVIMLSDNLEVLAIRKESNCMQWGDHFNNSNWKEPDQIPSCLSNSLKTVSFRSYGGDNDHLAMVGYILKHGNALKVVQICIGRWITNFEKKFELVTQISKFPRKSSVCELEFL